VCPSCLFLVDSLLPSHADGNRRRTQGVSPHESTPNTLRLVRRLEYTSKGTNTFISLQRTDQEVSTLSLSHSTIVGGSLVAGHGLVHQTVGPLLRATGRYDQLVRIGDL